ncbi:hypothetical protein [Gracilibacillus boraciitolerans]|nr:hypothetical protein [Gracilibacillus boraciitolerans]
MNSYNYSNSNPQRFYDSKGYKITEFIAKDFIGSSAQMAVGGMEHMRHMDAGKNYNWDYGSRFYSDMLVGGFKVAGVDNGVTQTYDAASKMWDGVEGYNQFRGGRPDILNSFRSSIDDSIIPTLGSKKNILNKLIPPAPVQKVLSKLSVPGAALGAVSSGGKIIDSSFEAFKAWNSDSSTAEKAVSTASAGENVGDFLMSAGGAITAAIPGGQAAGGILAAAGAGIWAVSKGVKWYAKNSEKINKGIKKAGKAVVDGASKAWNFTKGLFS